MKIYLETIPESEQRYPTLGDYYYDGEVLRIKVSKQVNPWYDYMIAIHELTEVMLTEYRGIEEKQILEWDLNHDESEDPGAIVGAPYYDDHMFCLNIEKQICSYLGIDWDIYNSG